MPLDTPLNDDFIIDLLEKDATASRFGGFSAQKRDKNAPKPNTRFLRHIVREADTHNAALLARENEESRARLRDLGRNGKRKRDDDAGSGQVEKRKNHGERSGRWASAFGGLGRGTEAKDRAARRHDKPEEQSHRHRDDAREERRHSRERNERDRRRQDDRSHRKHKRRRSRDDNSRSRSRSTEHSPEQRSRHRRRERSRERRGSPANDFQIRGTASSPQEKASLEARDEADDNGASDSDPLDAFLGPPPPPTSRPRGRGANAARNSNMDLRFNDPSYDPKADVSLDAEDANDWDTALEAMRDRAKWRAHGASRLREAGFSEKDVAKWEGNGREKDERDVRWSSKAEGREWDKGKVLDKDGGVVGKASWTTGTGS